jgi:deoxycytidylate deaminase
MKRPEIVVGLVVPTGANLNALPGMLRDHVDQYDYRIERFKLSSFLSRFKELVGGTVAKPHGERTESLMTAGNKLREITQRNDILALVAINEIHHKRRKSKGAVKTSDETIHVLESLKRPEEVAALRSVYGDGFFLLGLYSSEECRLSYLKNDKRVPEELAKALILRDQNEDGEFGQRTRETFQLADAFINLDDPDAKAQINRVIDLLFGDPFITPTADEHAMFLAYASSLRSADLSRQVGAVIVSASDEIISTGANDVPSPGGGLYWPGEGDFRDHVLGRDSNASIKNGIILDIIRLLREQGIQGDDQILRDAITTSMSKSTLLDITEFGRPVHAEMEAILACARVGVSPVDGTLYSTTFPCHNCAKHIVAAGLKKVVYVEPYPKSQAGDLYSDSLSIVGKSEEVSNKTRDSEAATKKCVNFVPFVGVAARHYVDLFSMKLGSGRALTRKGADGIKKIEWKQKSAWPRMIIAPTSFLDREKEAANIVENALEK